jgi:NADH-quinone oxidoreductase subunit N
MGKLPLFSSGIAGHHYVLVVILGMNSAIAAYYYLRLAAFPHLEAPTSDGASTYTPSPYAARRVAGALSALGVVVLVVVGGPFAEKAEVAARHVPPVNMTTPAQAVATDHATP